MSSLKDMLNKKVLYAVSDTIYIVELVLHIDHEVLRKWLSEDWQVLSLNDSLYLCYWMYF